MMFNGANTAFMLLAAALVLIMTPGLAFFYGGLVGRTNTLTIMVQSFASMAITTVLWWAVGYSLSFSGGADGLYGNFHYALLRHVGARSLYAPSQIPLTVLIVYQLMFAIITPALITGAFANRVRFGAYLLFLIGWQLAVYYPFVHMIWGGGLLEHWGVRDFADGIAALAFLNTTLGAGFAATTWLFMEWKTTKKPHFVSLLTGAIAGLACVTPAAGYVPIWAAAVIGIAAAVVCHSAIRLKNRLRWDDALDVWGVHGVGGLLGIVLLGAFAGTAINPAGAQGLIHGVGGFFAKEVAAGVGCAAYSFVFTYAMLRVIDLITPVHVGAEEEQGLDAAELGEAAYVFDGPAPAATPSAAAAGG
jgi:Amt family ammonium transporter